MKNIFFLADGFRARSHLQSEAPHSFALDIFRWRTREAGARHPLIHYPYASTPISECTCEACPMLRWHAVTAGSLKCTRATSVHNLKLSCHPLAKLYGAFIMFPATVTRKLLGPRPGSPVKTEEINPSAEAAAKSLFPPCSLVSRIAPSFYSYILYRPYIRPFKKNAQWSSIRSFIIQINRLI